MFDVVALGELLIDFVCQSKNDAGYPTLAANPGGAPGNFLAALQAYGCTTAMLSKVGTDALGKLLVGTLENLGIHTRGIVMADDVFTTLAFVTLDNTGNREFSFARKPGADTRLTQAEVLSSGLIDDCRVFHFGTLSLTDEPAKLITGTSFAPTEVLALRDLEETSGKVTVWGDVFAKEVKNGRPVSYTHLDVYKRQGRGFRQPFPAK